MSGIIVSQKLTMSESLDAIPRAEEWFKKNPKRKICRIDNFKVRRGFTGTDILKHTNIPMEY